MHKTPIDLRRLLPLVLLTLTLLAPSLVSAADSAQTADPEQPTTPEQPADIPRANETPAFGYVYTVEAGDDLWQIAVAHGLDMEALAAENHIDPPYWLQPGDKLWVPAKPAVVRRPTPPPPPPPPVAEQPAGGQAEAQPQPESAPAPDSGASSESQTVRAAASSDLSPDAALILNNMNERRAAWGLAPLIWNSQLATAAQAHANDLAQRGWGGHVGSDGAHLRTRYDRVGYWATYASENWANARGPQHAFEMWWFEPDWGPHRLNILGPNYVEIGIGIAKGGWGYYYVADFGSR